MEEFLSLKLDQRLLCVDNRIGKLSFFLNISNIHGWFLQSRR